MTETSPSPPETRQTGDRLIDRLLARFDARHHALANRALQFVAIPLLTWSGLALAKTLPQPAALAAVPVIDWGWVAAVAISAGYAVLSWRLGAAMAALAVPMLALAAYYQGDEMLPLWQPAIVFLALGALIWLFGRRIEGRPRLLGEMAFDLLMGPAWLLARVLTWLRIGY